MVIINPTISTQPAALTRPAGPAPVLPPDRVLNAVVLGERAQHLYELASGSLRMMAESQTPLREGEQLQLRVLGKDAQQRPQLEILQRGTQDIAPQLRSRLPEQLSLNQLAASLNQIRQGENPSLRQLIAPLLNQLPRRQQLTHSEGLQKALHNSGQQLESKLARGEVPQGDLKATLLKLLAALQQQSPPPPKAGLARSYGPLPHSAPGATPSPAATGAELGQSAPSRAPLAPKPPSTAPSSSPSTATAAPPHTASYQASPPPQGLPGELHAQGRLAATMPEPESAQLSRLTQDIKGALARQDANQLLGLHSREHGGSYMVELPVRDRDGIDIWQFQFQPPRQQRDDSAEGRAATPPDSPSGWSIALSFDLPGLGAITARVTQRENQLGIRFSAAQSDTVSLLQQHSQELNQRLADQGIDVGHIDCRRSGPQPSTESSYSLSTLLRDQA